MFDKHTKPIIWMIVGIVTLPTIIWMIVAMFGIIAGLAHWRVTHHESPTVFNVVCRFGSMDGSVLFWEDGPLVNPILRRTGSHLTHAAIILNGYIYEAVPPRVHKVLLADYLKEMKAKHEKLPRFKYFVINPKEPYTETEIGWMIFYAESQLGRPYAIRGWNRRETRGIFCSALVSDILEYGGRIKSGGIYESPGSLYKKLLPIYERAQ
jgi:hypothetical protein